MANYVPNSWGRTRRPKQMSETAPVNMQDATEVSVVTAGNLANDLDGTEAGENGYTTENQRFVHILVKGGNSKSITLYGYNYAFREWAAIFVPLGNATTSQITATTGASGGAQMYVFEIAGVDRIAFVSADAPSTVRAACSTF